MAQQTVAPASHTLMAKIAQISERLERVENPFSGSIPRVEPASQEQPWSKAS